MLEFTGAFGTIFTDSLHADDFPQEKLRRFEENLIQREALKLEMSKLLVQTVHTTFAVPSSEEPLSEKLSLTPNRIFNCYYYLIIVKIENVNKLSMS